MAVRGAYSTRQRALIVGYLGAHPGQWLTADALARGAGVGRTTAYRLLEALAGQGAALKDPAQDGPQRYLFVEDPEACARHAHMVCTACGALIHLECGQVRALTAHLWDGHGFALDGRRTVLYGRCRRCAKEEG